jgi:cytosine/adenosine deaminase-related metal-dependent hydrolase
VSDPEWRHPKTTFNEDAELYDRARPDYPELFGMADRIGTVAEGKQADLIVVDGDPLADIAALADASRVRVVVKEGRVVKDLDGPTTDVRESSDRSGLAVSG